MATKGAPGQRQARKEIRKIRRERVKKDLSTRQRVERQLAEDGVMPRVAAAQTAVRRPEIIEAIQAAIREHEALRGQLKDYHVLRSVVATALSLQGLDLRDVMLKFTWNGKDLGIFAAPSLDAVKAAAKAIKLDEEEAFKGMLVQ